MLNNEIKLNNQAKGTRILLGDLAALKRMLINSWVATAESYGYKEIILPSIERVEVYVDKIGEELAERQMYRFPDKKGRALCLRPEGTATCQLIAQQYRFDKDIKLFYDVRCWRYEQPQKGRYREFSQFGIEILNPTKDYREELISMATAMVEDFIDSKLLKVNKTVSRGLSYYTGDGFEIEIPDMGAQSQIVGGGSYKEGIGFAIGVDRLLSKLTS